MGKPVAHQVHETDGGGVWKTGVCAGAGGMCCDAGAETRGVWHALSGGIVARLSLCQCAEPMTNWRVAPEVWDGETVRAMNTTLATNRALGAARSSMRVKPSVPILSPFFMCYCTALFVNTHTLKRCFMSRSRQKQKHKHRQHTADIFVMSRGRGAATLHEQAAPPGSS